VPVYQTSTYEQDGIGSPRIRVFTERHPTRQALEEPGLAGGREIYGLGSGRAASLPKPPSCSGWKPGDHICGDDIYGGTPPASCRESVKTTRGAAQTSYADMTSVAAFEKRSRIDSNHLDRNTTNPLLKIADLKSALALARARKIWLAVDNTFASPIQRRRLSSPRIALHIADPQHDEIILGGHMRS